MTQSVSFYFYTGDFAEALRRFKLGESQYYATHDEVAALMLSLSDLDINVTIYSYMTEMYSETSVEKNIKVVCLGGKKNPNNILASAVSSDCSDKIIAHMPNLELLCAITQKSARSMVFMANTYSRITPKSLINLYRTIKLLNDDKFEFVANHCRPATEQLRRFGVKSNKLFAWDIAHTRTPQDFPVRIFVEKEQYDLFYAGTIYTEKGVSDIILSLKALKDMNFNVRCTFAGDGQIQHMKELAQSIGVADKVTFLGKIENSEVINKMEKADLIVIPSRSSFPEGFPLTMFEAIASRTPTVCSDHYVFRNAFVDGINVIFFKNGDAKSLAYAIRSVLTNGTLYNKLSKAADLSWCLLQQTVNWRKFAYAWIVHE